MTLVWAVDMLARQKKFSINHPQTAVPILFFMLSAILSFVIGQLPWYATAHHAPIDAQIGGLAIFALSGLAFLLVANLFRDLRWLKALTWIFLGITAIYISGRLIPIWGHFLRLFYQRGAVAGSVFWIWMIIIPFTQAYFNTKLKMPVRVALMGFTGLVLFVGVFFASDWKSGYLPPLAGIAVIVAILLKKRVLWFIPVGLVLVWMVGIESIASESYSWMTRLEAWRIVSQLTLVNPIFGLGFGKYYHYSPIISINGWHVNFNSHSQYIDIFAQTGLLGLCMYAWVFWRIGMLGWKLRTRAPEGFERAYVYGVLGGLMGMLVAGGLVDWVLPFVYNIGLDGFRSSVIGWMFLGGLVVINRVVDDQEKQQKILLDSGRKE